MSSSPLDLLVYNPAGWNHTGLAAAAARAGAVGVLDLDNSIPSGSALSLLRNLIDSTSGGERIGLRIPGSRPDLIEDLAGALENRPHHLLIHAYSAAELSAVENRPAPRDGRTILAEFADPEGIGKLDSGYWAGVVLCGNEAGGAIGGTSAFLHAQRGAGSLPFYIRGGIGPLSAAACRTAGAAGVVVEEAAWLLPDCPLPVSHKALLRGLAGQETRLLGDVPHCQRVLGLPVFSRLGEVAQALERGETSPRIGWGETDEAVWPVGQAIGLATTCAEKHANLSHLLEAIRSAAVELPRRAGSRRAMASGAKLAGAQGTEFPIVQGPMTRVSDVPEFASAVAEAGGLPMLALALMKKEAALPLLEKTAALLGGKPWGVGILGFVPPDLQAQQIEAILAVRPPCAIIAGGQPDQSAALEREGISTFLHVPSPALLRIFLRQGARKFIFEGRECGGHVGPLGSFVLWSEMIGVLEQSGCADIQILFAGGIHDAKSAAMAAAIAEPALEAGAAWGVLMGTAYLFTEEAVATGAITRTYQEEALRCRATACLPVATGHANRCAQTPFAEEYGRVRRELLARGAPPEDIRVALEEMTLGRLRLATKGLRRDKDGGLGSVPAETQLAEGMYMIGDAACLRSETVSMRGLHEGIAQGACRLLQDFAAPQIEVGDTAAPREPPSEVAIVGMSAFLPDAPDTDAYWRNLLNRHCAIREVPKDRWDWRLHYDPDRNAPSKTNSKWGGFFPDVPIDLARLGIPPASARTISTSNLLCLEAARLALADAGYANRDFDRERTAVILANADGGGHLGHALIMRSLLLLFDPDPQEEVFARMPPIKEESLPGTLTNVVAGRVSNRLDLGGPNYTVDAACASSLAVMDLAVRELESGRSSVVLAGATETVQGPPAFVAFSKVGALSGSGTSRPFDADADGIVLSDGVAFLVLKRLADARRDGDRVYAIIRGVGGSSDGKALGMTAPRPLGQKRALTRAYARAGFGTGGIQLYEAHATGTPVGDRAELETIIGALEAEGTRKNTVTLGATKGLLGHARTSAGMAALIKTVLAVHHKVLPPLPGITKPLPGIDDENSPVAVRRVPHPWLAPADTARRAGVSAFGFGGTNFHVVLEEDRQPLAPRPSGGADWPAELVFLVGRNEAAVRQRAKILRAALRAEPGLKLRDVALTCAVEVAPDADGAAVLATSISDLAETLDKLAAEKPDSDPSNVFRKSDATRVDGKLAFLFPGQASQYPDMAAEAALYLDPLREMLETADKVTAGMFARPLSQYIHPPAAFAPERIAAQRRQLTATEIAQPSLGAVSLGFHEFLRALGIVPDMAAGHSFGELAALAAAGTIEPGAALRLAALRGAAMAACGGGAMAAVHAPRTEIEALLPNWPGVVVANHNAPRQVVVSGPLERVEALVEHLNSQGTRCAMLPVSGAFHSPAMEAAREHWLGDIAETNWKNTAFPVMRGGEQVVFPEAPPEAKQLLAGQLTAPVEFVATIEALHREGARIFVEVGPRNVLCGLTGQILKGREHLCLALDEEGQGITGVLRTIAALWRAGVNLRPAALFAGRDARLLDLSALAERPSAEVSKTTWFVNSTSVRRPGEEVGIYGEKPLVTLEDRDAARKKKQEAPPPVAAAAAAPGAAQIYAAYQETMRQFLKLQETVVAQWSGAGAAAGHMPAVPEFPMPATPLAAPAQDAGRPEAPVTADAPPEPEEAELEAAETPSAPTTAEGMLELVTSIVSDKTGYPPDMLGADQDIEAELGIDSIKRVEIMDAIKTRLAPDGGEFFADRLPALTRIKTLRGLAEALCEPMEATPPAPEMTPTVAADEPQITTSTSVEEAPSSAEAAAKADCPRFVMEARPEPITSPVEMPLEGLFLITADTLGTAEQLAEHIRANGALAEILPRGALAAEAETARMVGEARQRHGAVRGIIHLAPVAETTLPADPAGWRELTRIETKSLFQLLQLCSADLQRTGLPALGRVLATSAFGGHYGRGEPGWRGSPAGGGGVGLVKTLDLEWPTSIMKCVDFDVSMGAERMAAACLAELLHPGSQIEVGYPGGERQIFVPARAEAPCVAPFRPAPGEVLLATGGARGITAKCLRAMAAEGAVFVIVGRGERTGGAAEEFGGVDLDAIRKQLLARNRNAASPATPAEIERAARRAFHAVEMETNLRALEAAGVEVEYHAVDVRDPSAFAGLLQGVYRRHGKIDHVLHGAGVLADRLIEDKTSQSFDEVFDTKADAMFLLCQGLKLDTLKSVVLFSSVAGRFGNPGQADYAAANETLNRFALLLRGSAPAVKVLSINWGPWADGGMATPDVARKLRERGILAIEPAAGVRALLREWGGAATDTEIILGDGPWNWEMAEWHEAFDAALFLLDPKEPLAPAP